VKWQRNAIFDAVVAGKLDPRRCNFEYGDAGVRLTHVASESYFLLEGDPGHYTATAVVGEGPGWPTETFSWTKVEERVQRWAEEVKRDVDTPDLWAELQHEREILTGARYADIENTPFTADEQAQITDQIRQIKELVKKTYSLTEAQMRSLEAKLDYIDAAAGHVGRKDWLLLLCGVMLTVIVGDLLSPEAVQYILSTALHGLDHLFGSGSIPPQLPPTT
jgi:hypothetical protein